MFKCVSEIRYYSTPMTDIPPRFPITRRQIERVVTRFYARVRRDPVLGPIFEDRVGKDDDAWRQHEGKITRFWANAILHERSYAGNPMQVHMAVHSIKGDHFARWLTLFDQVLKAELPPDTARSFSSLAHRIGRGLRMGVEDFRAPLDAVPRL